jgi:hypothetical protein
MRSESFRIRILMLACAFHFAFHPLYLRLAFRQKFSNEIRSAV